MNNSKIIILQPEYMKKFSCIGAACEDSCCIGWRVDLDKKTYLDYKKINNSELKPIIEKMVNRKHNMKNDVSYARIKMEANSKCPFLNKENLCKIYINAGEKYLSNTCTFYPRHISKVDGKFERSATMSCPEVARLALLNEKGIVFEQAEQDKEEKIIVHDIMDTEGHLYLNKPNRYFWEIRMFSISLLQNRNYTLYERLIILGIIYKKIEELSKNNSTKSIPATLEVMNELIEAGDLKQEIEKVPSNIEIQMRMAKELTDEKIFEGFKSDRYMECLKETLAGIGFIEGGNFSDALEKYEYNCKEYLIPYLQEKEYVLENYLVNEYFKDLMPFGNFKTMWDSYMFLCVLYSMIKLHLIGMSGYHKGLNDELTLKLIQSFSKIVLHNNKFIQKIIQLIKDSDCDSLAYMSILLKN